MRGKGMNVQKVYALYPTRRHLSVLTVAMLFVAIAACTTQTNRGSAPTDAGPDSSEASDSSDASSGTTGCNGLLSEACIGGKVQTYCCPAGAECVVGAYCELGGGACVLGACGGDAAVADASGDAALNDGDAE